MQDLSARQVNRDGLFAFVVEPWNTIAATIELSYGMQQVLNAGIPNIIFDLAQSNLARQGPSCEQVLLDIERSFTFMRERLPAETARRGRIYANIADFFDVFEEDTDQLLRVLKLLAAKQIDTLMFKDTRGTHFPFQTVEIVALLRRYFPAPRKILVHPDAANGLEDATVIDALTLLPDPGPGGKLNTDLEGRDDKAAEAAIFAGIQGTVGCPAVGAGCDA